MILKDSEEISKEELKELTDAVFLAFPDWKKTKHQILKYHPSIVKIDRINKGKDIKPPIVPVSPEASIDTGDGYHNYRYFKTRSKPSGKDAEWNFTPDVIQVGPRYKVSNLEELIFLYHFCPIIEQSLAPRSERTRVRLTFENIRTESAKSNTSALQLAKYTLLLFETLTEQQLRILGNRYMVSNSEEMDVELLKRQIDSAIRNLPNGINEFMDGVSQTKEAAKVESISENVEEVAILNGLYKDGILTYGTPKNKWVYNGEEIYFEMKPATAGADKLYKFLQKDKPELLEELLNQVVA